MMESAESFDPHRGEQPIFSGYVAAVMFVCFSFVISLWGSPYLLGWGLDHIDQMLLMVCVVLVGMLGAEYYARRSSPSKTVLSHNQRTAPPSHRYIFISALWRFCALFSLFLLMYFVVQSHYYFDRHVGFEMTRRFFDYLLYIYLIGGVPYIYVTLYFRWGRTYEYNDYGIVLLIFVKQLVRAQPNWKRLCNHRIRKVFLSFLVTFFFLTLMLRFFYGEHHAFEHALSVAMSSSFGEMRLYQQHHQVYLVLYHLLFVVDVGIAIIGYTVSSRWLHNRVRSVDQTLGGWLVALLCYPPLNSGFADHFIGYGHIAHAGWIHNEAVLMILKTAVVCLFGIYVWSTIALGFKFSNLTHRGIVTTGPYRFVRHPAYASKNIAWWLDSTFVLSNLWASLALLAWNLIYVLRGITEERHLQHDPKYRAYCKMVPYRFIYKLF
jgi:protein-S-isoprenylcysteine O-methyltransferase Ste14